MFQFVIIIWIFQALCWIKRARKKIKMHDADVFLSFVEKKCIASLNTECRWKVRARQNCLKRPKKKGKSKKNCSCWVFSKVIHQRRMETEKCKCHILKQRKKNAERSIILCCRKRLYSHPIWVWDLSLNSCNWSQYNLLYAFFGTTRTSRLSSRWHRRRNNQMLTEANILQPAVSN